MTGLKEFGESAANAVLERVGRGFSHVQERRPLSYDLLESDDAYLVVFDAPGAARSDVQVRFLDGEVQIRVDRFRDFHEGFEMRFPGRGLSLDGRAKMPGDASVDATEANATLAKNGTLRVRIPKESHTTDVEVVDEDDASEDEAAARDDGASVVIDTTEPAESEGETDDVDVEDPDEASDSGVDDSDDTSETDDSRSD